MTLPVTNELYLQFIEIEKVRLYDLTKYHSEAFSLRKYCFYFFGNIFVELIKFEDHKKIFCHLKKLIVTQPGMCPKRNKTENDKAHIHFATT